MPIQDYEETRPLTPGPLLYHGNEADLETPIGPTGHPSRDSEEGRATQGILTGAASNAEEQSLRHDQHVPTLGRFNHSQKRPQGSCILDFHPPADRG